jgi:large subunit ribosomal protein L32
MAVQKSRRTPATRGNRRLHDKLKNPALSTDSTTGETHLRHNVGADGYYRGKKIFNTPAEDLD